MQRLIEMLKIYREDKKVNCYYKYYYVESMAALELKKYYKSRPNNMKTEFEFDPYIEDKNEFNLVDISIDEIKTGYIDITTSKYKNSNPESDERRVYDKIIYLAKSYLLGDEMPPIVVLENNNIINGHHRFFALMYLYKTRKNKEKWKKIKVYKIQ